MAAQSRIEDIIDDNIPYSGSILSRIEGILDELYWNVPYNGTFQSRISLLLNGDRRISPMSEIERIIYYGKDYRGPITSRVSKLLFDTLHPAEWDTFYIGDSYGGYLIDNDGDYIYGRRPKV
ncbi:MAG: hypothetical protein IIT65_07850 [Lachnospiraceae bacterium]|nr:hypothetical protein [Lachnospiraceae bacterium]